MIALIRQLVAHRLVRSNAFRHDKAAGFTLVELLVATVVIGILAAIVLIAFAAVQVRARNVLTIDTIKVYRQALIAYATVNHVYPDPATFTNACLGEPYYANCIGDSNSTFNSGLRPYMHNANQLPLPTTRSLPYSSGLRAGAGFDISPNFTIDGVSYPWGITYRIEGLNSCGLGDVLAPAVGQDWPNFSTTPDPVRSGFTERRIGGNTLCRIKMPDPSVL